jgi:hypothetical protein
MRCVLTRGWSARPGRCLANDNEHWLSLTLYGVTYSYDSYNYEWLTNLGPAYDRGS